MRGWRRHRSTVIAILSLATLGWSAGLAREQSQTTMVNPPAGVASTGAGAISGVAVDRETHQPLGGVLVEVGPRLVTVTDQSRRQLTDAKGRFIFTRLPPASYTVSATKNGYLRATLGSSGTDVNTAIMLADGQWARDLSLSLSRAASIAGVVLDDRGQPIVNAYVRALSVIPIAGSPQLAAGALVRTDDRGAYRISGLPSGTYYVQMPSVQNSFPESTSEDVLAGTTAFDRTLAASEGRAMVFGDPIVDAGGGVQALAGRYPVPPRDADGRLMVYPVTFAPSDRTIATAVPIELKAGDARTGVDLRVAAVRGVRLAGVVDGPAESLAGLTVRLLIPGTEALGEGSEAATSLVDRTGRFAFVNVPAGSYVVAARSTVVEYQFTTSDVRLPRGPGVVVGSRGAGVAPVGDVRLQLSGRLGDTASGAYWGRTEVTADDRDRADLVVSMRKGVTLSGRFVVEGAPPRTPDVLFATAANGSAALGFAYSQVETGSTDRFTIAGLVPGSYVLGSRRLKSAVCDGQDYSARAIDLSSGADVSGCVVTFTDQTCRITGAVRAGPDRSLAETVVIAFPVEPDQWTSVGPNPARIKTSSVSVRGNYAFVLPGGRYFVVAAPASQIEARHSDPSFFGRAATQAIEVRLAWGAQAVQDLVVQTIATR